MNNQTELNQLNLLFYDTAVTIKSDAERYLAIFADMYPRFISEQEADSALIFTIVTKPNEQWAEPVLLIGDQALPLRNEGHVYETILSAVIANVRSHILIHAGVVSYQNKGIIIAADSGHGKTTLVLELLRRGCHFLSDEMAVLGRQDSLLYPFPRSLRIRPGTLERVGLSDKIAAAPTWLDKLLVDIEYLKAGSLGGVTPLSHIFILKNPVASTEPERTLGILVDQLNDTIVADIQRLSGVTAVHVGQDRGYPYLKVEATNRTAIIPEVQRLCQHQQIVLLDVVKRKAERPKFDTSAKLEPFPVSKATLELLRHFKPGYHASLMQQEFGGSSKAMFIEMMSLIGQAKTFALHTGPLSAMADLVCEQVGLPNS